MTTKRDLGASPFRILDVKESYEKYRNLFPGKVKVKVGRPYKIRERDTGYYDTFFRISIHWKSRHGLEEGVIHCTYFATNDRLFQLFHMRIRGRYL